MVVVGSIHLGCLASALFVVGAWPFPLKATGAVPEYKVVDQRRGTPGCEGLPEHTPVEPESVAAAVPSILKSVLEWYGASEYRQCGRTTSCRVFVPVDGVPPVRRMAVKLGTPPTSAPTATRKERIFYVTVQRSSDPKGTVIMVKQGSYVRGALLLDQIDIFQVLYAPRAHVACLTSRIMS
jgi:hypothetical protein